MGLGHAAWANAWSRTRPFVQGTCDERHQGVGCVQETDNPDLRDRAYVYWRLLGDPETARQVLPLASLLHACNLAAQAAGLTKRQLGRSCKLCLLGRAVPKLWLL